MAENNSVLESTDGDSLEKKRARRRLVGATALALLAAIVLPMVMDHEPRPSSQDVQVRIPNQETASPTQPLSGKPLPTPLSGVAEKTEAPKRAAESAPTKPEAKAETPAPVAKSDTKSESKDAKAEPKPAESAKPPEAKAADAKPTETKAEAARAEKILNGGHADGGQWILQLGAYQDVGNVKVLQGKIKELGYASYTEKVTTPQGDRIRVRAGPFASRDAAEKAQARLKKVGAGGPPGGVVAQK